MTSAEDVDDYSLTMIQKSERLKISSKGVDCFKKYLEHWEKPLAASLTLFTENAVYLRDKKFFDDLCDERREILSLMKILPPENFMEEQAEYFFARKKHCERNARPIDTLKHESRSYPENILGEPEILSTLKEKIRCALNVQKK